MAYNELRETDFTYFTDDEDRLIQQWLKDNGYSWQHNTVCGDCCGMYEDTYWVNGIGGKWKKGDVSRFEDFCKEKGIGAEVSGYHITAKTA